MSVSVGGTASASRWREAVGSRRLRHGARALVGAAVLAAIVARVGAAPFLHGVLSLDLPTLGAAVVLVAAATAAAAWRWRVIAGGLGVGLRWPAAVGAYYTSQFVNSVLPGGVIGDVQRAVDHGRSSGGVGPAARAVAVERLVGQAVQVAIALVVLAVFGMEFAAALLPAIGAGIAVAVAAAGAAAATSARLRRVLVREAVTLRVALGPVAVWAQAVAASIIVCVCHLATFALAAAAVGASLPPVRMLTLAIVVLLAASLPFTLGGWGPREGVAGWAFAVAGLGASAGVSAATLYGVLALVSIAPGALAARIAALGRRRNRS
jgi:uncharacterized membrane protein YbhN (UPF0104 family)